MRAFANGCTAMTGVEAVSNGVAAFREPVIMSAAKARRELGWRAKHSALETLRETITAARMGRLVR